MTYKAIGFDYGGVIAGMSGTEFDRRVTQILGVDLDTYRYTYFQNNRLLNSGALPVEKFWEKILSELGRSDKLAEFLSFRSQNPDKINNEVLDLARQLKTNGYKIGILSNNNSAGAKAMRNAGLMDLFDVVAVSYEIGFIKPDPKAFEIFIERLEVKPAELVFIDDSKKSLESASEIGYSPILFTEVGELRTELKKIGVKI